MTDFVTSFAKKIFNIANPEEFSELAISLFHYQYAHCAIYKEYVDCLQISANQIQKVLDIPFMPIQFFKHHLIISSNNDPKMCFESSATTGSVVSKHFVCNPTIYIESFTRGFETHFGNTKNTAILALLPSYLERSGSSLVFMIDYLISQSSIKESGFFLSDFDKLHKTLLELAQQKIKTILFGVTFGLLDFIENHQLHFPELIIIETGGMKGRREEITRAQLHQTLCAGFGVEHIYSEYGMTELLSQAYTHGEMVFSPPPWMNVFVRETNDPLTTKAEGNHVGLNIIDLANIESCAFIATQDLGNVYANGQFEVLGRFDDSEIRGCNLMAL